MVCTQLKLVSNGYNLKKGEGDITLNWTSIWKIPGPEKLCFLIWLAWHDSLPTMQSLQKRGVVQSPFCTRDVLQE